MMIVSAPNPVSEPPKDAPRRKPFCRVRTSAMVLRSMLSAVSVKVCAYQPELMTFWKLRECSLVRSLA